MNVETLALIASYLICAEAAEVRLLDKTEVETCTSIYTEVKLSFVPEIGFDEYHMMSAAERAEVNSQGYAEFSTWRAANLDLMADLPSRFGH